MNDEMGAGFPNEYQHESLSKTYNLYFIFIKNIIEGISLWLLVIWPCDVYESIMYVHIY